MPFCPSCGTKMQASDPAVAASKDVLPAARPALEERSSAQTIVGGMALVALVVVAIIAIGAMTKGSVHGILNGVSAIVATPTPIPPPYQTSTYQVAPDSYETVTITSQGSPGTLEGYILISGGNQDVGFSVRGPSGGYLVNLPRVAGRYNFHYMLPEVGPYIVTFDNSFSLLTGKVVTAYWRAYW